MKAQTRYPVPVMGVGSVRIRGIVRRGGDVVEGAYITLNQNGEFIAERRTGPDGSYEFHCTPGAWVVTCRAAGADAADRKLDTQPGDVEVDFDI